MNSAAGPFFVGDEPIDVTNALWDASGFLYPRNAFKLFNGRTRILGNREIGGMYRYVRRNEPPFFTGASFFLVADSQFVWRDSSVTDTLLGFKKQPIGTQRGTAKTTSGSAVVVSGGGGSNSPTKWLQYVIPKDYFLGGVLDSATYFRIAGRARIKVGLAVNDDTLFLDANADSTTATAIANYAIMPTLDIGSLKYFSGNSNRAWFGDSTKPIWGFDGTSTFAGFVVDSGRTYANTTTILRDGSKAWFPNQWRSYWVRFSNRMVFDRGGAGGADSMVRSCWSPITGNDDTSLTLRFDPIYGNSGATYYIMALPVERQSVEQNLSAAHAAGISDSAFVSNTTGFTFGDGSSAILSYPLSVLITDGPNYGQVKMVSAVYSDSLFLLDEKLRVAINVNSKFVFIQNMPVMPKIIISHQDRLWYAGDPQTPNRAYYSEPLEPGNVGPFNYIDVFPRDGDVLTNLASYNDQLLAYKNNSIARIVGDNPSNFIALPFLDNLGTPGVNTRTSFGGEEYFYDKNSGIYVLREFNPVRLSDPVKPLLDSIPSAGAKNAALTVFKDHLWFSYPSGNAQIKNNRLLTYNIKFNDVATWSRHTFNRAANFATWPLAGDSSRLTVGDPDSGLVYFYNDTARIDAYQTNRVKLTYKTGWLPLSTPEFRKQFRGFQLGFDADTISGSAGDVDSCYLYKDFATTAFDTLLFSRAGQLNNYVTKDINREGLGRMFQLEMRIAPRTAFKLYFARTKWANVGEKQ